VGQTAVLAVVVESTVFPSIEEPADLHYEVSAEPGSVGIIERVWSGLPLAERQTAIGKMCFHALHGRDEACQGCPVFEGDVRDRKPTVTLLPDGEPSIRILTVHATTNRTLYLSAHPVDDDLIGELLQARISALATASGLSRRERSVLRYLLLGRSLDEVGKILGISTRTVRFHQTNLLEKLGADSRLDILRLLS
jgi:DNA-binding CsgD family transcriptional regulator